MNCNKRVMRLDADDARFFREDEALFREDFQKLVEGSVLFSGGARIGAFLHDTAHVTASGVFPYSDGKGGVRMEWRPQEEIEHTLFLDSLQGVPMTLLHPKNTRTAPGSIIGMVKSRGMVEGSGVRSEVVVHDSESVTKTKARGLSLGFTCDLIMESGLTPDGVKYDAIQRNLRADHLAVVPNPRVKSARLNLDNDDTGKPKMPTVRLDSGIEYEAAAEVIHELNGLKTKLAQESARADSESAKATSALADVTKLTDEVAKVKTDAQASAFELAKQRIKLEEVAEAHKVSVKADASDLDLMTGVVKAIRGDSFDLTGKTEDYVRAAYDFAVTDSKSTTNHARKVTLHGDSRDTKEPEKREDASDKVSAAAKQSSMMEGLGRSA
jgi:hypothetical protein